MHVCVLFASTRVSGFDPQLAATCCARDGKKHAQALCPGTIVPAELFPLVFRNALEGFNDVTSGVDLLCHAHRAFPTQPKHSSLDQQRVDRGPDCCRLHTVVGPFCPPVSCFPGTGRDIVNLRHFIPPPPAQGNSRCSCGSSSVLWSLGRTRALPASTISWAGCGRPR